MPEPEPPDLPELIRTYRREYPNAILPDRRAHRAELAKALAPERLTPDTADLKGLRQLAGTQNRQDQPPQLARQVYS